MRFSAREDIKAPAHDVFAALTNFSDFERAALRRGIDVVRNDAAGAPALGASWQVDFPFRGRQRRMHVLLDRLEVNELVGATAEVSGLTSDAQLELVPLSPQHTRLRIVVDLKPKTISARLFLQSVRLTKSGLTNRFKSGRLP